ncbi:MAG: Stp1/IreP family PP2C-type Ser/Thr phosphatase [Erysipelotrichaceae bacterium]|nr:Stp1/IreP family PP2C-type Ser/Thr phosphatase [Erysipelotrichaceae bacterium]
MNIVIRSDVGKIRKVNQDYVRSYQKSDDEAIIVLCDGMGGHNAGEIASKMTADDIIEEYQLHDSFNGISEIREWMHKVINHAHYKVQKQGEENAEEEGMGTTVVLALYVQNQIYISHVGDSRAYIYQDDKLNQLTKDDTLVNVLIDAGTISKDEAYFHPQKNILLQAVGVSEFLNISFISTNLNDHILLVCSDGLYNSLFDKQITDVLAQDISLENKGDELLALANKFGGKDNIGFALMTVKEDNP